MTMLLSAASTGNGVGAVNIGQPGLYIFRVGGTFGGATVKLQELGVDGSTWDDVPDTSLTAAGKIVIALAKGASVRAAISGGTGVSVYADLRFAGAVGV